MPYGSVQAGFNERRYRPVVRKQIPEDELRGVTSGVEIIIVALGELIAICILIVKVVDGAVAGSTEVEAAPFDAVIVELDGGVFSNDVCTAEAKALGELITGLEARRVRNDVGSPVLKVERREVAVAQVVGEAALGHEVERTHGSFVIGVYVHLCEGVAGKSKQQRAGCQE